MTDQSYSQPRRERWSDYFCRSRSAQFEFAARKSTKYNVLTALDRIADRYGGGAPGYGYAADYGWNLPTGRAEYNTGVFFQNGLWISNVASLLLLCHVMDLVPPRFATDDQRDAASAALEALRERLMPNPQIDHDLDRHPVRGDHLPQRRVPPNDS